MRGLASRFALSAVLALALAPAAGAQNNPECKGPPYHLLHKSDVARYPVVVSNVNYTIRALGPREALAHKVDAYLKNWEVWKQFAPADRLGKPLAGADGRVPIFILPRSDSAANEPDTPPERRSLAYVYSFCDDPRSIYMAITEDAAADEELLQAVVVHESFHIFQSDGRNQWRPQSGWWTEATATWAQGSLKRYYNIERDNKRYFDHPEIPLGENLGGYSAWRFVKHLEKRYFDINDFEKTQFFAFLRRAFEGLTSNPANNRTPNQVIAAELARDNLNLGAELGTFWGEHLVGTLDNGPAAKMMHDEVMTSDRRELEVTMKADPLAAYTSQLRVRARARSLVTLTFPDPPPDTHVWILVGSSPRRLKTGGEVIRACIASSGGDADSLHDLGVRVAFTVADNVAASYKYTATLQPASSRCSGPPKPPDPQPRPPDEYQLPRSCPARPVGMPDRFAPHNGRIYDFVERVRQQFVKTGDWAFLQSEKAAEKRFASKPVRLRERRKIAAWWRCGAQLIRRIDNPVRRTDRRHARPQARLDPILRRERKRLATALDKVATATEKNNPKMAARWALRGGTALGVMLARRLRCDFEHDRTKDCPLPTREPSPSNQEEIDFPLPGQEG